MQPPRSSPVPMTLIHVIMSTVSPEIYPEHTEAGAFTTWHSTETGPRCHGRSSLLQPEHLTFLLPVCLITCNCPLGKQIWRKCKLWICLLNDQTRFPPRHAHPCSSLRCVRRQDEGRATRALGEPGSSGGAGRSCTAVHIADCPAPNVTVHSAIA